jgi:hypothetical protein
MAQSSKDLPISIFSDWYKKSMQEKQEQDIRLSDVFAALTGLPTLPGPLTIQDRWYKDETIQVDTYTFERCRFDRYKLVTEYATFVFRNCFISADCRLFFKGPSLKVLKLVMHYLRIQNRVQMMEGEEGVYAILNPDGTFSLE